MSKSALFAFILSIGFHNLAFAGLCEDKVLSMVNTRFTTLDDADKKSGTHNVKETVADEGVSNGFSVSSHQEVIVQTGPSGYVVYTPRGKFELNNSGSCNAERSGHASPKKPNYYKVFAEKFIEPLQEYCRYKTPQELKESESFSINRGQCNAALTACMNSENEVFREAAQNVLLVIDSQKSGWLTKPKKSSATSGTR